MGWITAFSMAFGMFCAIPFPVRRWDERQRARMLVCFPWVGAIIGAIWAFACWLLRRIGFSGVLAGALLTALPLLLRLLDPAVGIAGADSCIFFGAFALCPYAAGTWISQSISQGGMDAPKLSSMHNMVGLLYVLSVLLGPVLLLRLGWEQ